MSVFVSQGGCKALFAFAAAFGGLNVMAMGHGSFPKLLFKIS